MNESCQDECVMHAVPEDVSERRCVSGRRGCCCSGSCHPKLFWEELFCSASVSSSYIIKMISLTDSQSKSCVFECIRRFLLSELTLVWAAVLKVLTSTVSTRKLPFIFLSWHSVAQIASSFPPIISAVATRTTKVTCKYILSALTTLAFSVSSGAPLEALLWFLLWIFLPSLFAYVLLEYLRVL